MILLLALACQPAPPVAGEPEAGTLVLEQIRAPGLAIGEAFLVVGPDGTSVLIDVADDPHADAVREALIRHTGEEGVDHVVLTHLHMDHIGGFDTLFPSVAIRGSVVLRGGVVGDGASATETARLETTLAGLDADVVRLCAADPCLDLPHSVALGDGAMLTIALANARMAGPDGVIAADVAIDPDESDGENAMSLGGFVTWGDFAYVFAGDLGGGGKGTPDVEGFVAEHAGTAWPPDAEALHLDHHGISSSTNDAWVARFLAQGVHHGLVGSNSGYLDAPDEGVLDRLEPALGGGMVWASDAGSLTGDHDVLVEAEANVTLTVTDAGASYGIALRDGTTSTPQGTWSSNP